MPGDDEARDEQSGKRRGKRAVLVLYIAVTTVFVGMSALDIIPAALGLGVRPLASTSARPAEAACAERISAMTGAVDRAARDAVAAHANPAGWEDKQSLMDESAALSAFRAALAPEWDDANEVEATCKAEARGAEAFAALLRLRLAEELFLRRELVEIAPLRRDVAAYLPH